MNKRNYQAELETRIRALGGSAPPLLLHSCCAPCSSYVLEYLSPHFGVTVFYCNPNIFPEEEYRKRKAEQLRMIEIRSFSRPVRVLDCDYDPGAFRAAVRGLERCPEGGARCGACFLLRLRAAAAAARENGFSLFGSTLTVGPQKNAEAVNRAGAAAAAEYGVEWLPGDFKKKNGFLRSAILAREMGLYRQKYCGCEFSLKRGNEEERNNG